MGSLEIIRVEEEGFVLQAIKDGRRAITNGEMGMGKVYCTALRKNVTQQDSQDIFGRKVFDDMVNVLAIPINWRENITRR